MLYMMDSTTITLFDNILKGVGRHPKSGKKKGGMKVHLPKDSVLAMDRAYIDYAQFQRLTEEGVCYVTKMKKNLRYTVLSSVISVNEYGLAECRDERILFEKGELKHESRRVEIWSKGRRSLWYFSPTMLSSPQRILQRFIVEGGPLRPFISS